MVALQKKKQLAVFMVLMLLLAALAGLFMFSGKPAPGAEATIDEILSVQSRRKADPGCILVPLSSPFYSLVATPVAVYYSGSDMKASPILVVGINNETAEQGPSRTVRRFIEAYKPDNMLSLGVDNALLQELGTYGPALQLCEGIESDSLRAAEEFWETADAVVLIEKSKQGYVVGVSAASVASYLNIPVVVADKVDSHVTSTLERLGVKYSIVCGDIEGYGRVWRLNSPGDVRNLTALGVGKESKSIFNDRLNHESNYIAMANPMDAFEPAVVESFTETFAGEVESQGTGSSSFPSMDPNSPRHYITIPEDYIYANVIIDSRLDFSQNPIPGSNPDIEGQRSYTYFGIDADEDGVMVHDEDSLSDKLHFMVPSLSYSTIRDASGRAVQGWGYMEKPIYHSTGKKMLSLLATLHDCGEASAYGLPPPTSTYTISVTVEKLEAPNYPLMPKLSCLASYLAAYRGGMVLAEPDFGLHSSDFHTLNDSGDPAQTPEIIDAANEHTFGIKEQLNQVLAELAGMGADTDADAALESAEDIVALAEHYSSLNHTMHLGIIADTNMIPWFYFENSGQDSYGPWEGYYTPGDNGYADIDMGMEDMPFSVTDEEHSLELAVGRIVGWDAQDVSALLARTFFYDSVIEGSGLRGSDWKDSAFTSFGTSPPVGTSKTVTEKIDAAFGQAGFSVESTYDGPLSDSKLTAPLYARSNFIYFCAHGFYYWYVPPGMKPTGVGGGYDTAHVYAMDFGPSVMFASSCVTGKIDGIQPYNAISQSFLHAGFNSYIGASRLSWGGLSIMDPNSGEAYGSYLALLMYGYLTGYLYDKDGGLMEENPGDMSIGAALMKAKNTYIELQGMDGGGANSDTILEFNLHGDPAFNPYEPNHEG